MAQPSPVDRLTPNTVDPDPVIQFRRWYEEAVAAAVRQPDAMTLATATTDGRVSARTVLMRGLDERGVAFYTNKESDKANELAQNPRAALVFHWRELERQVRITGAVSELPRQDGQRYWETRPRGHRIGAWASPQSRVIDAHELDARLAATESRFTGTEPPLPPFWGGYVVAIDELECWQGRANRLHDRVRYRRDARAEWQRNQLAP
jgi:pyridoxamine 5'-phosphate oxidase